MIRKYLTKVPGLVMCIPLFIGGAILGFTPIATAQDRPQCASAATDPDGDGWGYENGRSCVVPTSDRTVQSTNGRPACTAAAINNGNGWGWENDQSCIYTSSSSANSGTPVCTAAAINNGNGWGWENDQSCVYTAESSSSTSAAASAGRPICTSAAFNNGDGWGWENDQSCVYAANSTSTGTTNGANSDTSNIVFNTGGNQCSARAIDNGDGYGFEYGASCVWGDVQPAGDTNGGDGAAPPPVAAASPGFDNATGRPICLTDASDGNGDGFGYENNQTCKVVSGQTATSSNPLLNQRWCQPWAEISYGDYVLQNNTWNDSDVFYADRWSQCIELGGGPGNYVAKWDYNWLKRTEGNEYSVKSYPQVYYGRKTRNTTSGTPERLGLPANINNLPEFKVRYRYSETGNAERNVALESFFHTSCEAEEWNKHFEMMVWVNVPVTKTPGKLVAEATIDGKEWLVYTNPALSWGYVAFVEKTPSYQGTLNWSRFVDWTRNVGPSKGVWSIGNTCMGAIEIGTETFWGTGTFTLHEFEVYR